MPTITTESNAFQKLTDPTLQSGASAETNNARGKKPKKKALMIGVRGDHPVTTELPGEENKGDVADRDHETPREGQQTNKLKGTHIEVDRLRELLINEYSYLPEDIKVLKDDESLGQEAQPTHVNILRAISELVAGASEGDRFVFVFAGHSFQRPAGPEDDEEEDGQNEFIQASDGKEIQDNILHEMLVDPLPPDCKLTAIVDSCHSGTILDLKHHRCNRPFVPWLNKGNRRTQTRMYFTVRKQALLSEAKIPAATIETDMICSTRTLSGSRISKKTSISKTLTINTNLVASQMPDDPHRTLTESPTRYATDSPVQRFCDGHCRVNRSQDENMPRPDVICISSSQDNEKTWEDAEGKSMIHCLIKLLRENPHPILYDLMTDISHNIHRNFVDLHSRSRIYRKEWASYEQRKTRKRPRVPNRTETIVSKKRKLTIKNVASKRRKITAEMVNFQHPALSSLIPLNVKEKRLSL